MSRGGFVGAAGIEGLAARAASVMTEAGKSASNPWATSSARATSASDSPAVVRSELTSKNPDQWSWRRCRWYVVQSTTYHILHTTRTVSEPPVFLLSPARCDGRRAKVLLNESAQ